MGDQKYDEYGREKSNGLLHTAEIHQNEKDNQTHDKGHLVMQKGGGEETEDGIPAGGKGNGDGQDIVHQQGRSGNDAGFAADRMGGNDIPAAAVGKVFNDAGIGVGNNEYRERCGNSNKDGQVGVGSQSFERFFRPIGGG